MTAIYPDVTEALVFKALGDFITLVAGCEVIRAPGNKVPMPVGEFIAMTPQGQAQLSTNVHTYTETTKSIARSTKWSMQIDCYGKLAGDRAVTISTLLRDEYACEIMAGSGAQPLYATDPQQMPMVSGEAQYVERWTFEAVLSYTPVLTVPQDSALSAVVGLIDVDVAYPAS